MSIISFKQIRIGVTHRGLFISHLFYSTEITQVEWRFLKEFFLTYERDSMAAQGSVTR
jgi:hypothetical protein